MPRKLLLSAVVAAPGGQADVDEQLGAEVHQAELDGRADPGEQREQPAGRRQGPGLLCGLVLP